ncbi:MAG: hypothetical protein ACRD6W_06925, partial [Nitrososphaerales archaeon]
MRGPLGPLPGGLGWLAAIGEHGDHVVLAEDAGLRVWAALSGREVQLCVDRSRPALGFWREPGRPVVSGRRASRPPFGVRSLRVRRRQKGDRRGETVGVARIEAPRAVRDSRRRISWWWRAATWGCDGRCPGADGRHPGADGGSRLLGCRHRGMRRFWDTHTLTADTVAGLLVPALIVADRRSG